MSPFIPSPLAPPELAPPADKVAEPPAPDPRERVIRRAELQLDMLDWMAEMGMKLAEAAQRRAVAEADAHTRALENGVDPPADTSQRASHKDPGEIFVRATRAVRLTLHMQMQLEQTILKLREPPEAGPRGVKGGIKDDDAGVDQAPHDIIVYQDQIKRGGRYDRVRELVWDVIDQEFDDFTKGTAMCAAFHDKIVESDHYDEVLFRPMRACVEAICADLGLSPDWSRWTGDGWTQPVRRYGWHTYGRFVPPGSRREPGWTHSTPKRQ